MIDKDECLYPVEWLHAIKDEHEAWVEDRLNSADRRLAAEEQLYADIVDDFSLKIFEVWEDVAFGPLSPHPYWRTEYIDTVQRFRERILKAPWPGRFRELESGFIRLSMVLAVALEHFKAHADWERYREDNKTLWDHSFYRDFNDDADRIQREKAWDAWVDREHKLIREAAKCANWVCDLVRAHVNPYFRLSDGYALTHEHDLSGTLTLYNYSPTEITMALEDPGHSLY